MMHEIKLYTDPRENFTPAGLMKRCADQTPGVTYGSRFFCVAQLIINGAVHEYDHWSITREGGRDCVTLYLRRVSA